MLDIDYIDEEESFRHVDEAQEILDTTLHEEDVETIKDTYQDISRELKWGKIFDNAFPILMELAGELIETELSSSMTKNGSPWYLVGDGDLKLFEEEEEKSMPRRHYLLLMLAKKMLGGLKTRVNQTLENIRVLGPDEEMDLQDIADSAVYIDPPFVSILGNKVDKTEVVADIDISLEGNCRNGGRHVRTTIQWKRKNHQMLKQTYCNDCRKIISQVAEISPADYTPKECMHPGAQWVDGQEGKVAVCTTPSCQAIIPNPEIFKWTAVGLEPFGDDPAQDEVITLCSDY